MKTLKILGSIFFVLVLFLGADCQSYKRMHVVSAEGIYVRSEPSLNSSSKASIPYWNTLQVRDRPVKRDTVNGLSGTWVQVKYQSGEGFAFRPYLVYLDTLYHGEDPEYRTLQEGTTASNRLSFDPNFNWYGVYDSSNWLILKKVIISISPTNKAITWDGQAMDGFLIETGNVKQSQFLIGHKGELEELKIGPSINYSRAPFTFTSPDQKLTISDYGIRRNRELEIYSVGTGKEVGTCPKIGDYELRIREEGNSNNYQNLLDEFRLGGECAAIGVFWYGDINNDHETDFIFSSSTNQGSLRTFFISSNISGQIELIPSTSLWYGQ